MKRFKPVLAWTIAATLVLLGTSPARGDANTDWSPVQSALDAADQAYGIEASQCTAKSVPCESHDSPTHQKRVQAYTNAKALLTQFIDKWAGDPNWSTEPPSSSRTIQLLLRLAFVCNRAEDVASASTYYRLCLQSPRINDGLTTNITGGSALIRDVAVQGMKEQCRATFQACTIGTTGDVSSAKPWTQGGSTYDIASRHLAAGLTTQAPEILNHITLGQVDQVQAQIGLMAH
jgi:hypothetical protein